MPRPQLSPRVRRQVAERADHRCEYCWSPLRYSSAPFAVEHISPRSASGVDELSNLAFACQGCNGHKYTSTEGIDPATGMTAPIYNPRRQNWTDHFAWSEDYTIIIGVTPVGRATVSKLRLNRDGVVNLRQALVLLDEHPPSDY